MRDDLQHPLPEFDGADADDEARRRIDRIVEAYLTQLKSGQTPDRNSILAAHPNDAAVLGPRLALVETVFRAAQAPAAGNEPSAELANPLRAGPGDAGSQPATRLGAEVPQRLTIELQAEQARHFVCPHCGSHLQLVGPVHEVTCRTCGSTFQVEPEATATYRQAKHPESIGKFDILAVLGRGGFGIVYKARDRELDRIVTVKVPRSGYFSSAEEEERFLREARSAARLRHPRIVQVHDIGQHNGVPFIVSDFVQGITLADLMSVRPPGVRESADLVATLAEALDYAHRERIIHRDIKPSNVLIDGSGQPFITDFGLARREEGEITVTMDGQVLGTPAYMAPEQAAGDHTRIDRRSDVYSLGVVLYRLLCGQLPFQGSRLLLLYQVQHYEPRPPRSVNPALPRDLETICLKAMAKEPSGRYSTAHELADDLRRWLAGEPIRARPVGRAERFLRWCRRNPIEALLTIAIAMLLMVTAVGALGWGWRERRLRADVTAARDQTRDRMARHLVAEGTRVLDSGDLSAALVWFTEALALEKAQPARERIHRIRIGATLRQMPKLHQIWFHDGPVNHVEFNSAGDRMVTASLDGTASVCELASGRRLVLPHSDEVLHASFSQDSRFIATASRDRTAKLWDAETGKLALPPLEHPEPVRFVAFHPGGLRLATACNDGAARIWDRRTGKMVGPRLDHPARVTSLAFSPDGRLMVTTSGLNGPGQARLWDVETGKPAGQVMEHDHWVYHASFSHDGKRVATASVDFSARVWEVPTGKPLSTPMVHRGAVYFAWFSPDGTRLLTASEDASAQVWDLTNARPALPAMQHDGAVLSAQFGRAGERVVTASREGAARVWDGATGHAVLPVLRHGHLISRATMTPDGRWLATASQDASCRLWDLAGGRPSTPPLEHSDWVRLARFEPKDERIVTASDDRTARVWSALDGSELLRCNHGDVVIEAAIHINGRRIATASADGTARIWDAGSGKLLATLQHPDHVNHVAFHPRREQLVTACQDGAARIWRWDPVELLATLKHDGEVHMAWFSPDGRRVASASFDHTARTWDADTGAPLATVRCEAPVTRAVFHPDSKRFAAGGRDRKVRVWDVESGEPVSREFRDLLAITDMAFSPCGKFLLTVGTEQNVHIWDWQAGVLATPPLRHPAESLQGAAFSHNGQLVLTWFGKARLYQEGGRIGDGAARLWDAVTGQAASPLFVHRARVCDASFTLNDGRIVTASYDHTAQVWDASPDERPVEDLALLAQLLACHRIDALGGYVPLETEAIREIWSKLRTKYPDTFECSPAQVKACKAHEKLMRTDFLPKKWAAELPSERRP